MIHLQVVHPKNDGATYVPFAGDSQGSVRVRANVVDTDSIHSQVAVGTTSVPLRVGASDLANRKMLMLSSATAFYVGFDSGVTTSNGFLIPSNQVVVLNFDPDSDVTVYGIASSSIQVSIIEG